MDREEKKEEIRDRVVRIGRVVKVVKGGRRFSFNALVVSGDGAGRVGWGLGKANEVPEAIRKASVLARRSMVEVPLSGSTIPHDVSVKFGASKILMMPAKRGAGIIAGGALRAVMELAGVDDVVAKCHGNTNPHNVLKAAFDCLGTLSRKEDVFQRRGKELDGDGQDTKEKPGASSEASS